MSVNLLNTSPGRQQQSVLDQRESVFWVLLYTAYRCLPHSGTPESLGQVLTEVFDLPGPALGAYFSKLCQLQAFAEGRFKIKSAIDEVQELLGHLARAFSTRYDRHLESKQKLVQSSAYTLDELKQDKYYLAILEDIQSKKDIHNSCWLPALLRRYSDLIPTQQGVEDFCQHKIAPLEGMAEYTLSTSTGCLNSGSTYLSSGPALPSDSSFSMGKRSRTDDMSGKSSNKKLRQDFAFPAEST
jgi:hypothetical protein